MKEQCRGLVDEKDQVIEAHCEGCLDWMPDVNVEMLAMLKEIIYKNGRRLDIDLDTARAGIARAEQKE